MTLVDIERAADHVSRWEKTQEEKLKSILTHDYWSHGESWGNEITPSQVEKLGVRRPMVLLNQMIAKGIIRKVVETGFHLDFTDGLYEIVSEQKFCKTCWRYGDTNNYKVFVWDLENHLDKWHYNGGWAKYHRDLKVEDLFVSKHPNPRHNHKFNFVSLEDAYATFKCELCGYETHETITAAKEPYCEYGVFE